MAGEACAHELLDRLEIRAHLGGRRPAPGTFVLGEADAVLVHPVQLDHAGPAHFWLVARRNTATGALLEPLRQSLAITALSPLPCTWPATPRRWSGRAGSARCC